MPKTIRYKGDFLTFSQARKITRKLGLKSRREWEKLCRSGERPKNIPACPHLTYKKYGWTDYADFLNYIPGQRFLPFEQAREYVRSLGFKKTKEWTQYASSGERPKNIPCSPHIIHKKDFKTFRDWIGLPEEIFLPFVEARRYVRKNMTGRDWWEWCRDNRPSNIPIRPDHTYRNRGWKDWTDWFGERKKKFLTFSKARALARTLGIKRKKEWDLLCKQGIRPKNIPACPSNYYEEFVNYPDFFGYKARRRSKKNKA